jgi:hypothetical protein
MSVHREVHDKTETITSLTCTAKRNFWTRQPKKASELKQRSPANQPGFAFLLLTACDMARPGQAPATELVLVPI